MNFFLQHQELFMGMLASLAFSALPFVNRFLDRVTSSQMSKDLFWLMKKFEDGKLTKDELKQITEKIYDQLES